MHATDLARARDALASADALLIGAGAGMGVDSGLPDFRGDRGFWKAYPPYAELGLSFVEMANPAGFARDPAFAWGFYGHRLALYRETEPHRGFELLRRFGASLRHGAFVYTSNIDGHFQASAFDASRVVECHGTLQYLQCTEPCSAEIWEAPAEDVVVDMTTMRAHGPLPDCPRCGAVARPNVLMFGDWSWVSDRTGAQERRLQTWLGTSFEHLVIIEMGAGTAVPSVRHTSEAVARAKGGTLIRINPREYDVPAGHVGLATGALEALEALLSGKD